MVLRIAINFNVLGNLLTGDYFCFIPSLKLLPNSIHF
jgi:hypothetical protein